MHLTRSRGFTLIELLVVIAIIGLLSSVVLASLNSARQKGRDARRIADIKQLQTALELYYDQNGTYPIATANTVATNLSGLAPTYIPVLPADTNTATPYAYESLTSAGAACNGAGVTCPSYMLRATLETNHQVLSTSLTGNFGSGAAGGAPAYINGCVHTSVWNYCVKP